MSKDPVVEKKLALLKAAETLQNVSAACRATGFSRDSYYRIRTAYDTGGIAALRDKRSDRDKLQARVDTAVEKYVIVCALENPSLGKKKVSGLLKESGVDVSPSGVRSIWTRNQMLTFKDRAFRLIDHLHQTTQPPTDTQAKALKKYVEQTGLATSRQSPMNCRRNIWQERLQFEALISDLSAQFINLPVDRIDAEIENGQRSVCEALGFHSSALSEFSQDRTALIAKHCWFAKGGRDYSKAYRIVDSQLLDYLMEQFEKDNMFCFHDLQDLGDDSGLVKQICRKTGIMGGYVFPLRVGEIIIGAISWESHGEPVKWHAALMDRLRLLSEVFANALSRKRTETALRESIKEIKRLKDRLETENLYLLDEIRIEHRHHEIIGKSRSIDRLLGQVEQVADSVSTVLILGETGTGKELVARAIHNLSPRKDHPMVKINCSALPATLIESELFGHEKGAYSGALSRRSGRFEVAHESTLFLDEIGELPLELQPKLLRVLQEGEFERLGSVDTIDVNVRVIAATNIDLAKAVQSGSFRKDLYYRLNIFPITIAPLRERLEDIPLLVRAFVEEFSKRMRKRVETIPEKTIYRLQQYDWPGNVRELRNLVERAMILSKGKVLHIQLPEAKLSEIKETENIDQVQRNHILKVLEKCNWRVSGPDGAAKILGLHPNTLRFRMNKLNIERNQRYQ